MSLPRSGRAFDRDVLAAADGWGAGRCGVALLDRDGLVAERGSRDAALPWASVTKLATAWTSLIAVDRGLLALDDPAGPPGSTVRHLLAHASGLAFDDATVVSPPARTRIYSNTGYDALAATIEERAGRPFGVLMREWLLEPLGMTGARLAGKPSQGLVGTLRDLEALAFELLGPRPGGGGHGGPRDDGCVSRAARDPPRVRPPGPQRLGPGSEIRGGKAPHWTATGNSPRPTGTSAAAAPSCGSTPTRGSRLVALTDRTFGAWAIEAWPRFSDAVLAAAR